MFYAGDGWSYHRSGICRRRHCVLSSQRKLEHELARHLSTIRELLPEGQWGRGSGLHCSSPLYVDGSTICSSPKEALRIFSLDF